MAWTKLQSTPYFDTWSHSSVAANANNNTDALDVGAYEHVTVQSVWANHADTSTLTVQSSLDESNFDSLSATITSSGASGSGQAVISPTPFKQIRVRVTETDANATSTHTIYLFGKKVK